MIVECPKCHARYRIPEDKLQGKTGPLKVKCKKCGAIITVEPPKEDSIWYIAEKGERKGPFSLSDLREMVEKGKIGPETFVWTKGFSSWQKAKDVPQLSLFFEGEEEIEETQMLDSETIKRLTGEFEIPQEKEKEGEGEELLWQRHETSVLFSLDNYKPGMKTAGQHNAVIDLGPEIPEAPVQTGGEAEPPGIDEISLDEQAEARLKAVLEERKAQKTKLLLLGGIGALVVVLAVVGVLVLGGGKKKTNTPESAGEKAVVTQKRPQKKESPKKVEKKESREKETVKKKTEQAQEKPKAEEKKEATASTEKTEGKPVAPKKETVKKEKKVQKKVAVRERKQVRKTRKKTPIKREERPKKAKKSSGEAAEILSALGKGKKQGRKGESSHPVVAEENLPQVLPSGVVNRIMERARRKVKKCLIQGGIDPEDHPVIMSKLTITGKGRVQSVAIRGKVGDARGCIQNVLKGLKFPRFKQPTMTVTYPYMF